jgi:hypothetical protein
MPGMQAVHESPPFHPRKEKRVPPTLRVVWYTEDMEFVLITLADPEDADKIVLCRRYVSDRDFFPIDEINDELLEILKLSDLPFL